MLEKHHADRLGIISETQPPAAVVAFTMTTEEGQRSVRIRMPLPGLAEFLISPGGRKRPAGSQVEAHNTAVRERWRALALALKAKLVSIEAGVETFEEAFLAHIVMPGGSTVGQRVLPSVGEAYASGKNVPLLGDGR